MNSLDAVSFLKIPEPSRGAADQARGGRSPAGLAPLATGAAVMTTKVKIAVAAATVLAFSLALYFVLPDFFENSPEENQETTHVGRASEDGSQRVVAKEADEQKLASLVRVLFPPARVVDADDDAAASQGLRVTGKVTEPDGLPPIKARLSACIKARRSVTAAPYPPMNPPSPSCLNRETILFILRRKDTFPLKRPPASSKVKSPT